MIEDWLPQEGETVKYCDPDAEGFEYQIGVVHQIVETPHDNKPFCIRPQDDEAGRVWCFFEGIHPVHIRWLGHGDETPAEEPAPEEPEEVEPVITVQIETFPETENYGPSVIALQSDGTIWERDYKSTIWDQIPAPPQPPYH